MQDDDEMTSAELRACELASMALCAGIEEKWDEAGDHIQTLIEECQEPGLAIAMIGWCDTAIHFMPEVQIQRKLGQPVRLTFLDSVTHQVEEADDIPPPERWAGRMLAARAAWDKAMWDSLVESIPEESASDFLDGLFRVVTLNIRSRAEADDLAKFQSGYWYMRADGSGPE